LLRGNVAFWIFIYGAWQELSLEKYAQKQLRHPVSLNIDAC
jgi:hypothetical protein